MKTQHLFSSAALGLAAIQQAVACSTQSTHITFYGSPDNDPPGSTETAYTCGAVSGRGSNAGGTGTYQDPLTFATAKGEFNDCEIIYAPYLKKYLIYQDFCAQCTEDWTSSGTWHIDIWTGDSTNGGNTQIACENSLTPDSNQDIVRSPATNLEVDTNPTFSNGQCHTDHTYDNADASQYCNGGSGGGGSGSCSWEGHCADQQFDALIVGAGFSGIHQLNELLKLGLSVRVIDLASDIGGTWHFNCYPGAMSDTESFVYRYSWDKEDLQTYPWKNHYVHQPEVLEYLRHIVAKYDLRKHMQFNTEMLSADWDDEAQVWRVATSTGEVMAARYLVAALGVLSKRNIPDIPGASTFAGRLTHSASWSPDIDVRNKRVGVVGNGSTGVQIITDIAPKVASLTCFQRHPQYSVPSGNGPVTPAHRAWVNANYDAIWAQVRSSAVGFGFEESTRPVHSVPPAERAAIFERLWTRGNGFRFMFEGFGDIATSPAANDEACAFIRRKISQIVTDPIKAAKLTPREPLARRPICDAGYFAQFNRPHVDVVDLLATPIDAITPAGVRTADGRVHELDILVFATGFDAVDGNYTRIALRDRHGVALADRWAAGPSSYLGVFAGDCPNLFMVNGPQAPFCNNPPAFEAAVALITAALKHWSE
ncbi:putative cyclohexanone monooxygenase protein [Neofusicoccum parvum UCRNP2]|uniref:Putative cyclohexanone monooxygenase protein n=1 Tax=Botryosphaeria parva (strain UCR-NP2) TaxID=1287680 RepID=R1EF40_BOTPV|nr:putative cyclohexanone monooxygenase protein [Neofusicoccum parvum UCRNP2]